MEKWRKIYKLGKSKLSQNNVLVLKFDNRGILVEKDFFDKNDLREIEFEKNTTTTDINKRSVIGQFLYGIKQKIDDNLPLSQQPRWYQMLQVIKAVNDYLPIEDDTSLC